MQDFFFSHKQLNIYLVK